MVGFIGLGIMGKHMSANLIKAGVPLMVCDLNEEAVRAAEAASRVEALDAEPAPAESEEPSSEEPEE